MIDIAAVTTFALTHANDLLRYPGFAKGAPPEERAEAAGSALVELGFAVEKAAFGLESAAGFPETPAHADPTLAEILDAIATLIHLSRRLRDAP